MMKFYENLPTDFLIAFYNEMIIKIEKGILTKNMYYELGLIISIAGQRGITLRKPYDFEQIVDQKVLDKLIQCSIKCNEMKDNLVLTNEL